ncbi:MULTISPECIES: hypothetical protein [unclassified Streptomyces]|uniref:hypothetical protein n=1 Tax=unclassified Streptomyces TaxID=2593676 RepID=UPI00382C3714
MRRALSVIGEWINPGGARHRTVPPMEAGLRPNRRLDEARELLPEEGHEPDDVVLTASGALFFSSGDTLFELRADGPARPVAVLDGEIGTLLPYGAGREEGVVAAVEGVGLVTVHVTGATEPYCTDPLVTSCVTDATSLPDGSLLVTVGSLRESAAGWARALVSDDRSGRIVRIHGGAARVEAEGLPWPSGVEAVSTTEVLVSLSLDHRIERRRTAALDGPGASVIRNLPVYPGRLTATDDGCWVAAPYARNRFTELLLDEPELSAEMMESLSPEDWFVPRLRCTTPYTDTLQMGQLRVLGVIKPWAPPRSYGLVFRLDDSGRVAESAHSRADGLRHGVTGVAARGGRLVVAARGYRNLLQPQHVGEERTVTP